MAVVVRCWTGLAPDHPWACGLDAWGNGTGPIDPLWVLLDYHYLPLAEDLAIEDGLLDSTPPSGPSGDTAKDEPSYSPVAADRVDGAADKTCRDCIPEDNRRERRRAMVAGRRVVDRDIPDDTPEDRE